MAVLHQLVGKHVFSTNLYENYHQASNARLNPHVKRLKFKGLRKPDLNCSHQQPCTDDRRSMSLRGPKCGLVCVAPGDYARNSARERLDHLAAVVLYELAH